MSVLQGPVRNDQLRRRGGGVMRWWKVIAYPDVEVEIPVGDGLDVESNSRYRRNHLSNLYSHQYSEPPDFHCPRGRGASYLQSVEKCGLASVILEPRVSSLYDTGEEGGRAQIPNPRSGSGSPSSTTATPTTRTCWHPSLQAVPGRDLASPFFSKKCPSHKHLAPSVGSPCAALLMVHK